MGRRIMKNTCAVFDFDGCAAFFKDYEPEQGEYRELNLIFVDRGVPLLEVRRIYKNVCVRGFSPDALTSAFLAAGRKLERISEIKKDITAWLNKNLVVYDDARRLMEECRKQGIAVYILTMGDQEWQKEKVASSSLPYADIFIVRADDEKPKVVKKCGLQYDRVVVFDDKPGALDILRGLDPKQGRFRTVRVLRGESKYRGEESRHGHIQVTSLMDKKLEKLLPISAE